MARDFQLGGRSPVYGVNGMAATSMPAATLTALDVLRAGGNALDAAIAAAAVLAVIEPQSTGAGGDCFCLYAPAGGTPGGPVVALNGSGAAPAAADIGWFEENGITEFDLSSPHTVTVPGAVSGWEALVRAHGTKGLDELLAPAARFAEDGWPVHHRVAHDWREAEDTLRKGGAHAFLPGGQAPAEGDMFRQPALAHTLRAIGKHGARAFYEGEIAADMVAALRARGGLHTEEDFAAGLTRAEFVEPVRTDWRGMEVWQCPPNGSGLVALMLLGLLDGPPSVGGPLGAARVHRHVEASRLAYRDRDAFVADPRFGAVPVDRLLDPAYLGALRGLMEPGRAMRNLPAAGAAMLPAHPDTVYLCVVDRDGNACSFINSLFHSFGSGIMAEGSGLMLHNRGAGFRLERGHPNCIAGGKRPMHTIIPGMATQGGRAVMPFGVMGGQYQPIGQTWFLDNHFSYGLDIQEALDLPRVFPYGGTVALERGVPQAVADELARMGHTVEAALRPHGGGQAIWVDHARGLLVGGSDSRKDGMALGY